ncbi:helix-turn-helix domain-containing protein [Alicyclobacillus dauci]|uniref:MerR family transcriptional regulator n=1 Tax=Alicyclobacillus dauci TaxID=1475485 RepID=A0ABY6Z8Q7_9BACL|nr:MerR family transcriptional regulator [Alicyclobacillus dauci]WAH39308.1 MerR family transcriptional regulator [Alicyclobacillus dauci]
MASQELTVEMVVQRLGITPRTLHYYEEVGLISPVRRTSGGHRLYDDRTVAQLEQIMRLKETLGYSLQEIKQVLSVEEAMDSYRQDLGGNLTVEERRKILESSVQMLGDLVRQIDTKVGRLVQMKDAYQVRIVRAQEMIQELQDDP